MEVIRDNIKPILAHGNKLLSQRSEEVRVAHPDYSIQELHQIVEELRDTVMQSDTIIGVAGIHIGYPVRIMIYKDSNTNPLLLINPVITKFSDIKKPVMEGCLTLPDIYFMVERHSYVKVKYFDARMEPQQKKFKARAAQFMQHAIERMDGKLFTETLGPEICKKHKDKINAIKEGRHSSENYEMITKTGKIV